MYGENACLELDDEKRIRLDDWEMDSVVQEKIKQLWPSVNTANLLDITNFEEYQQEFLRLFGFGLEGVDYEQDVDPVHPF